MMKVSFSEIDEAYLRNKVDNGYYSSISEAVRDAVRKQREKEQSSLLSALEAGEKAIDDGKVRKFNKDIHDKIIKQGINKAKNNEYVMNPDVKPQ